MKAAVLHEIGGIPRYEDFPDPVAGDDEVIIDVKAVAVENVDKRIAAGTFPPSTASGPPGNAPIFGAAGSS
jgi:NADPH:quinone reductase-like Zn-dependent oxidoreductase